MRDTIVPGVSRHVVHGKVYVPIQQRPKLGSACVGCAFMKEDAPVDGCGLAPTCSRDGKHYIFIKVDEPVVY